METEGSEYKWNQVQDALDNLPLTWVKIGDYIVVMNDKTDIIIGGEPYLARQLWFNIKSGKIISRLWDQTVSLCKVASVAQFSEVCLAHFKGRPCLGYPYFEENCEQNYVVSQTPILRKISRACVKLLSPGTAASIISCPECLKLKPSASKEEMADIKTFTEDVCAPTAMMEVDTCINETMFKGDGEEDYSIKVEDKSLFSSAETTSSHTQKKQEEVEHPESPDFEQVLVTSEQPEGEYLPIEENVAKSGTEKRVYLPCDKRRKNEGQYACDTDDCGYRTKKKWNLQVHCKQLSHISSQLPHHTISDETEMGNTNGLSLTCQSCGMTFNDRRRYEIHKSSHGSGQDPLYKTCEVCGKAVQCRQFRKHMLRTHNVTGNFFVQCHWCEKKYSAYRYHTHAMRKHFYGKFICEKCPFSGYFAKDLIAHMNLDHEEDSCARCPSCKKEVLLTDLQSHYRSCILSKLRASEELFAQPEMCTKCGKTFTNRNSWATHKKSHLRKEGDDSLSYFCDKCDQKYASINSLRNHVRTVHENIRFSCSLCKMTFNNVQTLQSHNVTKHSTDKRYECKVCGVRKPNEWHLRRHERIHSDSQFQCSFCPKKLSSERNLADHERLHRGEKPFKCSMCSAAFVSKRGLGAHTKGAHKIEGPRGGKTGWKNYKK